jgi:GntR family transcriptional regulator
VTSSVMYQRIASDIRDKIKSGALPSGSKLPSTRELCDLYSVSTTVVRLAVVVLKSEGLVEGISGKGVYVI